MNKDIIKGHWEELKGKVKLQWGKITDNDVTKINGSREILQGKLQELYGYQKDQAEKEINEFLSHHQFKENEEENR